MTLIRYYFWGVVCAASMAQAAELTPTQCAIDL
jgi:hypothetical protein